MCRFLPFVFFLRQFHVLRWLLPFYTLGINDCVARALLTPSICSRLFYKMLQYFTPQYADFSSAIKTVYRCIWRKIMR